MPGEVTAQQEGVVPLFICLSYLPTGSKKIFRGYLASLPALYPFSLLLGEVNLYPG